MKKVILVLMLLSLIALAACSSPATPEGVQVVGEDNEPEVSITSKTKTGESAQEVSDEKVNSFPLNEGAMSSAFEIQGVEFVMRSTANEYGDKSSLIKAKGSSSYDTNLQVNYVYTPTSRLEGASLYLKVIGIGFSGEKDTIRYEGKLEEGPNTITFPTLLTYAAGNPRVDYCFGFGANFDPFEADDKEDIVCVSKTNEAPDNNIAPNAQSLSVAIDRDDNPPSGARDFFVSNDGTSALTAFLYAPSDSNGEYEITLEREVLHLNPGDNQELSVEVTWDSEDSAGGNTAPFYVYALPDNCNPSLACAQDAHISTMVELKLK